MEDTRRQDPLNQLNKVHINSLRLKQHAYNLHGSEPDPLHMYYSSFSLIFLWDSPVCRWVHLWLLFLLLELFSFWCFCLTQLRCDGFCFIVLFHYILLLYFRSLLFPNKRQKVSRSGWEGTLRRIEGGKL